jgi:RNA polymerase sigma-70 factor (ECF subfamily)
MRKKRAVTVPIENGDSDYPVIRDLSDQQMNPEEHLIKKQKKKILQSVVDQLKPRYKILVELRYFKEFSYQEIAEELNLPIGTIKAQLYRARELLYQILNKGKKNI